MSVSVRVEPSDRLVCFTLEGAVSIQQLRDAQESLRRDPQFRPEFDVLFDLRSATSGDIRSADVDALFSSSPFPASTRRAFVTSPGVSFGMGRVAGSLADMRGQSLRLFANLDLARRWLRDGETRTDA